MKYEVWDTPSGNVLAYFERYGQALDFLHDQVEGLGATWIEGIALLEVNADGRARELVASDRALLPLLRVPIGGGAPA